MTKVVNPTVYISFASEACRQAKRLLKRYSSKFSRRDFTQPQLMALAGMHQRFRLKWRELEDLVTEMPRLRGALGLRKAPDFSTIPKFLKRIPARMLDRFFGSGKCDVLGIDASGFSSTAASPHYEKRCGKKRPYLKGSIAVDLGSLEIQAMKARRSHAHDSRDFWPIAKKCEFKVVVADKAYDDESIHRRVHRSGADAIIPVRGRERKRVNGRHRKRLADSFDEKTYHQRSKVETVFSVVKRKLGEDVRSRSTNMQKKELKVKLWAYNVDRRIVLGLLHRLLRRCLC